jgi:hypothetical protein
LIDSAASANGIEFAQSTGQRVPPFREAALSQSDSYDPKRVTGYRLEQLAAAFDRVRHPQDWKAPIRAVIPARERAVVEKAVLWFTETEPVFEPAPGGTDRLMVMAPGYRHGPAGEPSDQAGSRFNR